MICRNCAQYTVEMKSPLCYGTADHDLVEGTADVEARDYDEGCYHCGLNKVHTYVQHFNAVA